MEKFNTSALMDFAFAVTPSDERSGANKISGLRPELQRDGKFSRVAAAVH